MKLKKLMALCLAATLSFSVLMVVMAATVLVGCGKKEITVSEMLEHVMKENSHHNE